MEFKGSRTEANLQAAFAGESQARNKYTYYAGIAKKEGYNQIANIFEETAGNEKEHAKIWFKLLTSGGVAHSSLPDTLTNLKDAAAGENYEWTEMYAEFAKVAKEEGFDTDLEKLVGGEALVKLFTVDVERRLCLLKISAATTVELAVDRGKIISGITGNECAVNETELEIKSGTKEDLLAYAGEIANLVPVTPEKRSKYERGMKLCGINLTRPAK